MAGLTVLDVIKRFLPGRTTPKARRWSQAPFWPADLFAVMAAIADRSRLYCDRSFMSHWANGHFALSDDWIKQVRQTGERWATNLVPPPSVRADWKELVTVYGGAEVDNRSQDRAWERIVFRLLSTADEASSGIGFPPHTYYQQLYFDDYLYWLSNYLEDPLVKGGRYLPFLPFSLCIQVQPEIACVQPKTCTPVVGCTLRSLTHHLALLPPVGTVSTAWYPTWKRDEDLDAFNVLIVPFPYSLPRGSFKCVSGCFPGTSKVRAFVADPDVWRRGASSEDIAKFLLELIKSAKQEVERVHVIVLPEIALGYNFAEEIANILAKESDLDLFLTGIFGGSDENDRNSAAVYRFENGEVVQASFQTKRHRWCLNEDQIRRYHLGHVLDPHCKWWEKIDLEPEACYMMLFRPRASLSVVICEDLARYDSVRTVMNAVGPNLVIALLMDGAQLEWRWPGRYATVLADDPGSAVLTVTSLGMVARSTMPGEPLHREIALWKEPNGRARVLNLPKGDHALLLALTSELVEQFALDGRSDDGMTVCFGLGAAHGIRHSEPPSWIGEVP